MVGCTTPVNYGAGTTWVKLNRRGHRVTIYGSVFVDGHHAITHTKGMTGRLNRMSA
jgi:hypothetical protein